MEKILSVNNININSPKIQQSYLRLELTQNIAATLSMKQIQEVLSITRDRITVMPNMPNCVFGLINQRSRIFWVVDLCQLLELQPIERSFQEYNLVIIRSKEAALGLIVPTIKGVIRLPLEDIQSPLGNVSLGLVPYLQGCLLQEKNILLVFDAEAIINSPVLPRN